MPDGSGTNDGSIAVAMRTTGSAFKIRKCARALRKIRGFPLGPPVGSKALEKRLLTCRFRVLPEVPDEDTSEEWERHRKTAPARVGEGPAPAAPGADLSVRDRRGRRRASSFFELRGPILATRPFRRLNGYETDNISLDAARPRDKNRRVAAAHGHPRAVGTAAFALVSAPF
jgi:hypothetical protein